MSRQEKKARAAEKVNNFKVGLAKFINSPNMFRLKKQRLIKANPQEKCLVERACVEMSHG
jgi:hypothetical protein